jgi:hypothetical protein
LACQTIGCRFAHSFRQGNLRSRVIARIGQLPLD